jgi:hypothetical protein
MTIVNSFNVLHIFFARGDIQLILSIAPLRLRGTTTRGTRMHSGFIALSLCFAIVPKISEGEIKYELSMEKLRGHNEHLNGSCTGFPFAWLLKASRS